MNTVSKFSFWHEFAEIFDSVKGFFVELVGFYLTLDREKTYYFLPATPYLEDCPLRGVE